METQVQSLFTLFIQCETWLSDIYMALATFTEEGQFSKVFDRAYYEAIEHKHHFIDLRKNIKKETELFSKVLIEEIHYFERQLLNLTKSTRNLEKSFSFYELANHMIDLEEKLIKLYLSICSEAWEQDRQQMTSIIAKKELRLKEMLLFRQEIKKSENYQNIA